MDVSEFTTRLAHLSEEDKKRVADKSNSQTKTEEVPECRPASQGAPQTVK
jgi:hypothetical protein